MPKVDARTRLDDRRYATILGTTAPRASEAASNRQ